LRTTQNPFSGQVHSTKCCTDNWHLQRKLQRLPLLLPPRQCYDLLFLQKLQPAAPIIDLTINHAFRPSGFYLTGFTVPRCSNKVAEAAVKAVLFDRAMQYIGCVLCSICRLQAAQQVAGPVLAARSAAWRD
jgi:hypothetical protein